MLLLALGRLISTYLVDIVHVNAEQGDVSCLTIEHDMTCSDFWTDDKESKTMLENSIGSFGAFRSITQIYSIMVHLSSDDG